MRMRWPPILPRALTLPRDRAAHATRCGRICIAIFMGCDIDLFDDKKDRAEPAKNPLALKSVSKSSAVSNINHVPE
ncbi:hypothetical protein [Hoeflea olei]|uniref:Uncharacterized protein n=1 Tax=Hoeflea olei TaxID=1480615 RepID=A0A1C1YQZ8_9HYPH|nr:hypothetical protein [Hoeflea olei]OCW55991.1 hypothetical protein AWJ14_12290 [Hoeflea olei]